MPINPPVCSSPIGTSSTSCLRKFTIHFRRPAKLKEKKNFPYKGEYGFDWLRDEYIYPIETVYVDEVRNPKHPKKINKPTALCLNPVELRKEYQKDVEHPITPYGQDYYPAWLSIFACGVNGNANSTMHNKGIYLTLQLDEIDEIADDGTEIILISSKPCLKVMPDKIPISNFIKAGKKTRTLGQGGLTVNYYELESVVKITCPGDTLDKHEEIKVFAKLGQTEVEVGKLMVYQNNIIPKANIIVINVITEYDADGNKIRPNHSYQVEELLKNQSLNQAMIQAEVIDVQDFDLIETYNKTLDKDINVFLEYIKDDDFIGNSDNTLLICIYLLHFYDEYGKHNLPAGEKINNTGHKNTYLFLTNLNLVMGQDRGVTPFEKDRYAKWKRNYLNSSIIFEKGLQNDYTVVHELAHSFSLTHLFDYGPSEHCFYQGYTENYMDYHDHLVFEYDINDPSKITGAILEDNPYKDKTYSFFKWQWDMMRDDQSMEY